MLYRLREIYRLSNIFFGIIRMPSPELSVGRDAASSAGQVGEFRARAFLKGMHRVCALVDEANRPQFPRIEENR